MMTVKEEQSMLKRRAEHEKNESSGLYAEVLTDRTINQIVFYEMKFS